MISIGAVYTETITQRRLYVCILLASHTNHDYIFMMHFFSFYHITLCLVSFRYEIHTINNAILFTFYCRYSDVMYILYIDTDTLCYCIWWHYNYHHLS